MSQGADIGAPSKHRQRNTCVHGMARIIPMCFERTMWENSTRSSLRNSTVPSSAMLTPAASRFLLAISCISEADRSQLDIVT